MSVPGPAGLVGVDQLHASSRAMTADRRGAQFTSSTRSGWSSAARVARLPRFWDDVDVLVSPTAGMLPPSVEWAPWDQSPEEHLATFSTFPNFAQPFNLSGQPAISLPLFWSADGLPSASSSRADASTR